ncbi:unnamed protein product [Brassica oleracea var. botrytis]
MQRATSSFSHKCGLWLVLVLTSLKLTPLNLVGRYTRIYMVMTILDTLFTGQDTGCYNFDCPGFVPIDQHFAVGAAAQSVSTLDGRQEQFPATIWKDPHSGHWWLKFSTKTVRPKFNGEKK